MNLPELRDEPAILRFGGWAFWHFFLGSAGVTTIRRGSVECSPMLPCLPVIVHTGKDIHVVRSRLLPWPFRTSIELFNENGRRWFVGQSWGFGVFGGYQSTSRIVDALTEAGFAVRETRIWLAP
jgi:hypothetical protein